MNEKLTMQRAQVELTANGLERRQLDGREYAIVPATIIVAGVLNGELVPVDALADFAEGWNGRPIPIGHPVDEAGDYIIANHPAVIEQSVIGSFFNANFDGQRIRGEMWIDVAKVERLGEVALGLLRRLEAGEVVELSTGYYAHTEPAQGVYNGKPYSAIQADLVPDHIALLPDEVGACSVADGCGAGRRNALRQAQGSLKTNQEHTGVMLAFFLRPEDAQALALTTSPDRVEVLPASELHVTLCYLGDIDELEIDEAWLLNMSSYIARDETLITTEVTGHGRFLNAEENEGMEPVFAIVQSEPLYRFRHRLAEFLSDSGSTPDRYHVYLPHITLAYAPSAVEVPLAIGRRTLVFDSLAVSWGDRTITFPLQGQLREEVTMNQQEKEQAKVVAKKKGVANDASASSTGEVSEAVAGGESGQTDTATVVATVEAEVPAGTENDLTGLIAEFGGVQGLRDALAAITANAQSQRATITARLLANRQNTFDAADLGRLDLAHLIKLDRALTPANYAGQGGAIFNGVQDDGFRAYQAPAMK